MEIILKEANLGMVFMLANPNYSTVIGSAGARCARINGFFSKNANIGDFDNLTGQ